MSEATNETNESRVAYLSITIGEKTRTYQLLTTTTDEEIFEMATACVQADVFDEDESIDCWEVMGTVKPGASIG
jgi:hypothetical protein